MMDEEAFEALYNETAPALRSYISSSCGDPELANDLLQEAFYRLLRRPTVTGSRPQLRGYLYKTAASLLKDHWRRASRDHRWRLGISLGNPASRGSTLRLDMALLFRKLGPKDQLLLWFAYVEGLDHQEIANSLNL